MSRHKLDIHIFKIMGGTHIFIGRIGLCGATKIGTIVKISQVFMPVYMPVETLFPLIGKYFQVSVPRTD